MSPRRRARSALAALVVGLWLAAAPAMAAPGCVAEAGECRVALTAQRELELLTVQIAVNAAIRPVSDEEAFGLVEHWTPIEGMGRGDCDDYAVTKLHRLVALGWPRGALRLTLAVLPDG